MTITTRPAGRTGPPAPPAAAAETWQRLAERWGREPARLPGALSDAESGAWARHCFATMRTASGPFRMGTRFKATPDVRFSTTAGLLRAPGTLLPDPADQDLERYRERVGAACPEPGWLLVVDQPLVVDFPLWSAVRDLIGGLWRRVGWPALPVTTELVTGHDYLRTGGLTRLPTTAGLLWVLAGTLTVRLWRPRARGTPRARATTSARATTPDPDPDLDPGPAPEPAGPDLELTGAAGDLLYWPAGYRHAELFAGGCLTLRLAVDGEHRQAGRSVRTLLADLAQAGPGYADDTAQYLPPVPATHGDGATGTAGPLAAIGSEVHRLVTDPALAQALRRQWAVRRSAAGLEPPPPILPAGPVPGPEDRIRVTTDILRLPEGDGRATWAVNGHLLPVTGAAGDRIRAALPAGAEIGVAELCRAVGAGDRLDAVLALLGKLLRLRAIEPVPAADDPTRVDGAEV